ncbi:MAG: hypothetical protein U1F66_09815 [bacterium]
MSSKIKPPSCFSLLLFLAIGALPVASSFMVIPPASAAQGECDCSHMKELQIELRNALRLQQAFLNKIAELRAMGRDTSQVALKQFTQGEARKGIEPVPGYKGPSEFDYDSWGRTLYEREGTKHSNEKLCGMTPYAVATLAATIAASACPGIGEAVRAHEEVHLNFCKRIGFLAYEDMHGADRAQEEAEAYGAQIKVLRDIIARLRCGYRVDEQFGPTKWTGVICSLEKPFTLHGSHPVVKFTLEFTPSSVTSGSWSLKTSIAAPASAFGSGTYRIEGANAETPRLVLAGTDTVTAMGRTGTVSHNPGNVKLIPLDTDECSQQQ